MQTITNIDERIADIRTRLNKYEKRYDIALRATNYMMVFTLIWAISFFTILCMYGDWTIEYLINANAIISMIDAIPAIVTWYISEKLLPKLRAEVELLKEQKIDFNIQAGLAAPAA